MLTTGMAGLRRLLKHDPLNTVALRRELADVMIEKEQWPFY